MYNVTLVGNRSPVSLLGESDGFGKAIGFVYALASMAGAGYSGYHGYVRNNGSLGWAIGWGLLGSVFPMITAPVAYAQYKLGGDSHERR